MSIVVLALQPARKPSIGGLPSWLGPSVGIVELKEPRMIRRAKHPEDALRLCERGFCTRDREEVPRRGCHLNGFGREGNQKIGKVETVFQKIGENLFGILRSGTGPKLVPRRDIARGRCCSQSWFESRQVAGLCTAARIAGNRSEERRVG